MKENILKHAIDWCKGEIFEGRTIFIFGLLCLIISFCFWKFGAMPSARTFIIPLLVVSLLLIGTGISMNFSNQKRIANYTTAYNENPEKFLQTEKERTEEFIKWYPAIRYIGAGILVAGLLIFLFTTSSLWKSISLCLMITAFAVFVIDFFSEERARHYYSKIIEAL